MLVSSFALTSSIVPSPNKICTTLLARPSKRIGKPQTEPQRLVAAVRAPSGRRCGRLRRRNRRRPSATGRRDNGNGYPSAVAGSRRVEREKTRRPCWDRRRGRRRPAGRRPMSDDPPASAANRRGSPPALWLPEINWTDQRISTDQQSHMARLV